MQRRCLRELQIPLFQHFDVIDPLHLRQPLIEHMVHKCRKFGELKGFAEEMSGSRLEGALLVAGLRREDKYREVSAGFDQLT